ncbi:hypothetical protein NIA73_01080 [Anaerobutyricum hallii]|nr:hypothetical protein [Anaerobutyricum hallii]
MAVKKRRMPVSKEWIVLMLLQKCYQKIKNADPLMQKKNRNRKRAMRV